MALQQGSTDEFDKNWLSRPETTYNHWTPGRPKNQIQLAFRNHWLLFREFMQYHGYESCLEVGCGRGTISSYFADNGFRCTLLDSSAGVLETAKGAFAKNEHTAEYVHADALDMPFPQESFDVVVSIGLLEHFQEIGQAIEEQYRILKKGGVFLGYIVPERPENIQRYFRWINRLLALVAKLTPQGVKATTQSKTDIFRSDYGSGRYLTSLDNLNVNDVKVMGVYPLPMISHSPDFPFSLLPAPFEWVLTRAFELMLFVRRLVFKRNPWICREEIGQAFLLVFRKGE